jgi:hypothetical protein
MRRFLLAMLTAVALPAAAQTSQLPQLAPVPEPPPPPPAYEFDPGLEPQVTIIKKENETVEEYRIGGRLYMVKVTPKGGKPYYLIDRNGDGQLTVGPRISVPMWIIKTF